MGGPGSGRWGGFKPDARPLVEDCRALDAAALVRDGLLGPNLHARGVTRWSRGGREVASAGLEVHTTDDGGTVRLTYPLVRGEERVGERDVPIGVERTARPYPRWWFRCPTCDRRSWKLYRPPGCWDFRCRVCHGLAYTSSRESRKFDAAFRGLAGSVGMGLGDVRRVMNGWSRRARYRHRQRPGVWTPPPPPPGPDRPAAFPKNRKETG